MVNNQLVVSCISYICLMPKIYDIVAQTSSISPAKLINAVLVWLSYHWFKKTKTGGHWGLPVSVSIEPTTACNLGCPECPSGLKQFTRNTGNLKPKLFNRILKQLTGSVSYINFYFQGEPYIHPQFLDLVRAAASEGIYTSTSTNAHFITDIIAKRTVESGLKQMIISIDGTTQETYEQYRIGGSLQKVIAGAQKMVYWKRELASKTPHLVFQFLVVKPNEHQIEEVKTLAGNLGIDEVRLKTAQVYNFEDGNVLIPDNQKYSRYVKGANGRWRIKNKLLNQCWRMWSSCVITQDGLVVPCCFDKDATHQMGDLKTHSIRDIWRNEKYRDFRASITTSRKEIDICTNCTEGTKVWG